MRCKALFRQWSSVRSGRETAEKSLGGNRLIQGERGSGAGGHRFREVKKGGGGS